MTQRKSKKEDTKPIEDDPSEGPRLSNDIIDAALARDPQAERIVDAEMKLQLVRLGTNFFYSRSILERFGVEWNEFYDNILGLAGLRWEDTFNAMRPGQYFGGYVFNDLCNRVGQQGDDEHFNRREDSAKRSENVPEEKRRSPPRQRTLSEGELSQSRPENDGDEPSGWAGLARNERIESDRDPDDDVQLACMDEALQSLTSEEQSLLKARGLLGNESKLTIKEIAKQLRLTDDTVRTKVTRVKKKLQAAFRQLLLAKDPA